MPLAAASEFPNDNPALHAGARWLCRSQRGSSRAVVSARDCSAGAAALPLPPRLRPLDGPLQLDLGRIILMHRAENVPPPPDFVFTPFSSSRPLPIARCQPIDALPAARRIERCCGVDTAPCIAIDPPLEAARPEQVAADFEGDETRYADTPISTPTILREEVIVRRRERASPRRLALRPLGAADEVAQAIAELESAFDEADPRIAVGA